VSIEANKAVIRRYKEDILNSRDLAALDVIVSEDYLDHAAFPKQGPGRAGLKQRVAYLFDAFDPHWTVHDIVAERDIVVARWSHSGIHRGEFLRAVAATGCAAGGLVGGTLTEWLGWASVLYVNVPIYPPPDAGIEESRMVVYGQLPDGWEPPREGR